MNETPSSQDAPRSTSSHWRPWIDAFVGTVFFMFVFSRLGIGGFDGGPVIKLAILISLAVSFTGPLVLVTHFILRRPVVSGVWLWGIHGVVGIVCLGIMLSMEFMALDNMGKFGLMIFSVGATMILQGIFALIAIYKQFITKGRREGYDRFGLLFCIVYALVVAYWCFFVWH